MVSAGAVTHCCPACAAGLQWNDLRKQLRERQKEVGGRGSEEGRLSCCALCSKRQLAFAGLRAGAPVTVLFDEFWFEGG